MLETVVLTRGQVWLSPEIREVVGLDQEDAQMGFAVLLDEALQVIEEKADVVQIARCA